MDATEFKELYDRYAMFDVSRDEEKSEVHVYLCWGCDEETYSSEILGNDNVTVSLDEGNYDRKEIKVLVHYGDTLICGETLLVPDNAPDAGVIH